MGNMRWGMSLIVNLGQGQGSRLPRTSAYEKHRESGEKKVAPTLRLLTPPVETPDPPNDTPGALKHVVFTPHDIPCSLRVRKLPKSTHDEKDTDDWD